jgi:hypothetical protein
MTRQRLEKQAELAERIGALMGETVIQSRLSRWLTLVSEGPLFFYVALARLADVDPGWVVMGELSEAPAPTAYLPRPKKVAHDRPAPRGDGGDEQRKRRGA